MLYDVQCMYNVRIHCTRSRTVCVCLVFILTVCIFIVLFKVKKNNLKIDLSNTSIDSNRHAMHSEMDELSERSFCYGQNGQTGQKDN